jgi:hypothetical protein
MDPPRPMRPLLAGAILALCSTAMPAPMAAAGMTGRAVAPPIAPHRDGNAAVAEELDLARRAGTVAAYDLFLARHPDHELARPARRERDLLAGRHHRD